MLFFCLIASPFLNYFSTLKTKKNMILLITRKIIYVFLRPWSWFCVFLQNWIRNLTFYGDQIQIDYKQTFFLKYGSSTLVCWIRFCRERPLILAHHILVPLVGFPSLMIARNAHYFISPLFLLYMVDLCARILFAATINLNRMWHSKFTLPLLLGDFFFTYFHNWSSIMQK